MSISTLGTLFQFIGGLGMFLYGMESMADGLQKFAGNRLQRVLEILTSNRLLGVLVLPRSFRVVPRRRLWSLVS